MNCTRCGAVLRDAAKFCGVCSHPTTLGAPQSGQQRLTRRSTWLTAVGVSSTNAFLVGAGVLVFGSLLAVGISANFRTGQSSPTATAVPATAVPAPVSPVKHVWPQIARDNFVNACSATSGGRATVCICALEKLQIIYSIEEFLELERRYSRGIPLPDIMVNIMTMCVLES